MTALPLFGQCPEEGNQTRWAPNIPILHNELGMATVAHRLRTF